MSVVLDGVNQYLRINANPPGGPGTPISISAWAKLDNATATHPVVGFDDATADNYLMQARGAIAGDPMAAAAHHLGGDWEIADTTTGYTASTWEHILVVFASTTSRSSYIDGGSKGIDTANVPVTWVGNGYWAIGSYGALSSFLAGKVAEVVVWNTILTDAQAAELAGGASPNTIESGNLKAWWPLYDNAKDVVGGFDLTAYNSPTYDTSDHLAGAGAPAPVDKTFSKKLVAAGNNEIWYESAADTLTELAAANGNIDTLKPFKMFEAFEKVFIVNGTNLKVVDFGNTELSTDDIAAGTAVPVPGSIIGKEVGAAISDPKFVVDYATALTTVANTKIYAKKITSGTISSGDVLRNSSGTISFTTDANEVAPTIPHFYDWTVYGKDTDGLGTYGAMPNQATSGCLWRGRPTLSSDKDYPHQWYQARQRNPWDWNYIDNDAQSPVAGGNSDAGEVGDIMIALIPYNRDYLIFGCAGSLWVLAGDAAEGGSLYEFESTAGILGRDAWCWDKEENLYLLTTTGILKIPKGFGPGENLTEQTYPDFIKDLAYDVSLHRITMEYDRLRNGIQISKTTLADGTNSCWWYDLKVNGLFPDTYPTQCGMFSMFHYEAVDPDYRKLLFGCNDGYIRFADDDAKDDDIGATDQAIDSYITFGPLKLGGEGREGKLTSLLGIPTGGLSGGSEADSSDLEYKIWTGQIADIVTEKLIANTSPVISGTIEARQYIRGKRKRRKIRGMFAGIRIGNDTATETWGLERLLVNIQEGGRLK